MLPNPNDLTYFLELYRIKNISRAAESLGITQPSLSLSLKRLETALGLTLFIRNKSGIIPTQSADQLSVDVEHLLDTWSRVTEKAKNTIETVKGRITIGCHSSVALYAVHPWLTQLNKDYEQIEFSFVHLLSRKIMEQIISFKIDIGLVINPVRHPDVVIKNLLKDEVTLRVSKENTYDRSTLIYDPDLAQVQDLLAKLKKRKVEIKKHITSSNLEFIEHLTAKGVGIGVLPSRVCKQKMDVFDPTIRPFKDQLALVYRADTPKTKSFDVVAEAIKNAFA